MHIETSLPLKSSGKGIMVDVVLHEIR